jgi:hypothetical protein
LNERRADLSVAMKTSCQTTNPMAYAWFRP